ISSLSLHDALPILVANWQLNYSASLSELLKEEPASSPESALSEESTPMVVSQSLDELVLITSSSLSNFPSGFGSSPLSQSTRPLKNSTGFCRKSPIAPAKVAKVSSCSWMKDRSIVFSYVKSGLVPGGVCGFADTLSGVTPNIMSQTGHFSTLNMQKVFPQNLFTRMDAARLRSASTTFGNFPAVKWPC